MPQFTEVLSREQDSVWPRVTVGVRRASDGPRKRGRSACLEPGSFSVAIAPLLTGPAFADTSLFTPATFKALNNVVACRLVNVSKKDLDLQIQIINTLGVIVDDTGLITVESGQVTVAHEFGGTEGERYCKFMGKFSKTAVRATITIFDPSGNPLSALKAE